MSKITLSWVESAGKAQNVMWAIIVEKNVAVREDSISDYHPYGHYVSGIHWFEYADCYRSRRAIVSVRPIGFILHCRRNKSGFGFSATSARTNVGGWTRKSWFSASGRTFSVRATNRRDIGMYEGNPTNPGRLPLAVVRRGAKGSIRIRHCGILNSFFFPSFFYSDLSSRLRTAVVIRKSTQVCKDRALKRRNLSREWTYEFQNWSATCIFRLLFIIATEDDENARYAKIHVKTDIYTTVVYSLFFKY